MGGGTRGWCVKQHEVRRKAEEAEPAPGIRGICVFNVSALLLLSCATQDCPHVFNDLFFFDRWMVQFWKQMAGSVYM